MRLTRGWVGEPHPPCAIVFRMRAAGLLSEMLGSTEASFTPRRGRGGSSGSFAARGEGANPFNFPTKRWRALALELISSPNDDYSRGRAGPTLIRARKAPRQPEGSAGLHGLRRRTARREHVPRRHMLRAHGLQQIDTAPPCAHPIPEARLWAEC
jgi:hypothetical protein